MRAGVSLLRCPVLGLVFLMWAGVPALYIFLRPGPAVRFLVRTVSYANWRAPPRGLRAAGRGP